MTSKKKNGSRETVVPDFKKEIVKDLIDKINKSKTILLASIKGLPGGQFHQIKKKLRGKAYVGVIKKNLLVRALEHSKDDSVKEVESLVGADVAILFSDLDAFELSALLTDNMSPSKAKSGDIAPEDITIESGPTDLVPGPAISELSAVGLKVAVENGKLAIKQGALVAKAGEDISAKVAAVLGKLNISPLKVGFTPLAAYDAKSKKVYKGIKIDKKGTLESLREAIGKSLGFSVNIKYVTEKNVGFFIARASLEEKALENIIQKATKEEA